MGDGPVTLRSSSTMLTDRRYGEVHVEEPTGSVKPAESEIVAAPSRAGLWVAVVSLLVALGSVAWCAVLQNRLVRTAGDLEVAQRAADTLERRLAAQDARLGVIGDSLGHKLGATQQEIETRADQMLRLQAVETARMEGLQKRAEKRLGAVTSDVSAVRSDVGGVRSEVASTKSDLAETKAQLQRTMGDAGVMSGLIARNHDELEVLKHRGDRTYYEFTLHKGEQPVLFAGVKLRLKKVNEKHARYTMLVSADDRDIEKKDKTVDEPVQFYTGKDPVLYELVVNEIGKNVISGYLSTPKGM